MTVVFIKNGTFGTLKKISKDEEFGDLKLFEN